MTRVRNTSGCFLTMVAHKNHLKKRKIWGRVCLRNIQNSRNSMKYYTVERPGLGMLNRCFQTISKHKNCFKKRKIWNKIVLKNFQLSNFTLTWSNEGKMYRLWPDMTYSKELQQKMKMLDKLIFKKHFSYTNLVKSCVMTIFRNSNCFLMGNERRLSQIGIIKVYENIPIQPQQVHKVLSLYYLFRTE